MKIVHLIDYFQPKLGYQETFLAKKQKELGCEISVVTSNYYYPFIYYNDHFKKLLGERKLVTGKKIEEDIETIRLFSIEIPQSPLLLMSGLRKTLARIQPDIVLCHGMYSFTSYFAAWYKDYIGYKLIYDNHAAYFNTKFNTLAKKLYRVLFQSFAVSKIKKSADKIFAIGEEERDFICDEFNLDKNQIPIIRLGADTDLFKFSQEARNSIRQKLNIRKEQVLIIFAGKINPQKKIDILLEAFRRQNSKHTKLLLMSAIDLKYKEKIERYLRSKNITLIDYVENVKLSDYFSAGDFAVWPGSPAITMLEAMSCGLPLILPESSGTKYLDESKAVLRFSKGNVEKLSENLKILIYNKRLREEMGRNAKEYIRKQLSWEEIAKQILDLIKS